MPTWAIVLIIVAAVVVAAFIALYFFGKRIQKRQDEQQEAIKAASQNMTLFIIDKKKASIGNLQRMFKIGFNRAARIMDQLSEAGVVGEEQGTKPREILMTAEQFEELLRQTQ